MVKTMRKVETHILPKLTAKEAPDHEILKRVDIS